MRSTATRFNALVSSLRDLDIQYDPPLTGRSYASKDEAGNSNLYLLRELAGTEGTKRMHTPKIPCNLLEMAMITNPYDEDLINEGATFNANTLGRLYIVGFVHDAYCYFNFRKVEYEQKEEN